LVTTTSACPAVWAGTIAEIVVLLSTAILTALTSTVTVAPARNPVPLMMTGVGRAVEPVDGEIAVTVGTLDASGGSGVGLEGDGPSQAGNAIANTSKRSRVCLVFVGVPPVRPRERESLARTRRRKEAWEEKL
jgi:hypothetical protein